MAEWHTQSYANYSNLPIEKSSTSSSSKKAVVLTLPKFIPNPHKFTKYSFGATLLDCAQCAKSIWGSELRCSACKFPAHNG